MFTNGHQIAGTWEWAHSFRPSRAFLSGKVGAVSSSAHASLRPHKCCCSHYVTPPLQIMAPILTSVIVNMLSCTAAILHGNCPRRGLNSPRHCTCTQEETKFQTQGGGEEGVGLENPTWQERLLSLWNSKSTPLTSYTANYQFRNANKAPPNAQRRCRTQLQQSSSPLMPRESWT